MFGGVLLVLFWLYKLNVAESMYIEIEGIGEDSVSKGPNTVTCFIQTENSLATSLTLYLNDEQVQECRNLSFGRYCQVTLDIDRGMHGSELCCSTQQTQTNYSICKELHVIYPPGRSALEHLGHVVVGEEVELRCVVIEHGNPQMYVYKRSRDGDDWYEESEDEIIWIEVNSECNTAYYCTPENTAGKGVTSQIIFDVAVYPTVESYIDMPVKSWQGGECGILFYIEVYLVWGTDDLEDRKQANGEKIQCVGENEYGALESLVTVLNVEYPPGRSVITTSQSIVDAGTVTSFSCESQGNPECDLYCFTQDYSEPVCVDDGNTWELYITSVLQEGLYSCYRSNKPAGEGGQEGDQSDPEI